MSLRHGVNSVLRHASGRDEVVDEYVIDYVTALLESNKVEECQREDVEALEEGLRGLVENVMDSSESGVDEVVEGLINLLREEGDGEESEDVSHGEHVDRNRINSEEDEEEEQEQVDTAPEKEHEEDTAESKEEAMEEKKIDDDVCMLRSLLGLKALKGDDDDDDDIQRRYIRRVLQSCSHDVHQAAEKLLQMQSTGELDIELNIERKREAARKGPPSPLLDDALKANIVSKYHLQAVPSHDSLTNNRKATKLKFPVGEEGKNKNKAQIRFRDGAVVSTKGEKYIVEKTLPEWDGGSRGRVKMKGKRGTGWV